MFADVIIPLGVDGVFTYSIPDKWRESVAKGALVVVPFTGDRRYTGVVYALRSEYRGKHKIRAIDFVIEEGFALSEIHLKFLLWISDYYMALPGEVIRAALPLTMRLESHTAIGLNNPMPEDMVLSHEEKRVVNLFTPGAYLSINEMDKLIKSSAASSLNELHDAMDKEQTALSIESGQDHNKREERLFGKDLLPVVHSLLERSVLIVKEVVDDLFKPKLEHFVSWGAIYDKSVIEILRSELSRAPARLNMLNRWYDYTTETGINSVTRKEFLEITGGKSAILTALCRLEILQITTKEVSRLDVSEVEIDKPSPLSEEQQQALQKISDLFEERSSVLLHGVTSSGKTEIYIRLIEDMIKEGKQVLYLLPEIALTVQIIKRLQRVFGDRVGIYHSGMSDRARVEMWHKQNSEEPYPIVLGVRSSIFLPYKNLGLVIIDEEHEASYKQKEPAPRYNGRDAAMMLASIYGAKSLLGSATPSLESYHNALSGKYGLVRLATRYGDVRMPKLLFADIGESRRKKMMHGSFTPLLLKEIKRTLDAGFQVILFQNRRGYSTYMRCDKCGEIPKCKYCDVNTTYYKRRNILSCHYCGSIRSLPEVCESCGKGKYVEQTPGTERIEEEIKELFPDARVARMDLEVISRKSLFRSLIEQFERGELDILVGTQMISKGLDFERVKLVGVIDADGLTGYPDFRSEERTYGQLMQVSGRSGRKGEQGKVVIQLSNPKNRVYGWVADGDYNSFYNSIAEERRVFRYPPFHRLIRIEMRHRSEYLLREAANHLAGTLRETLYQRVCGPAVPLIAKIRGLNRIHILIKTESGLYLQRVKRELRRGAEVLAADPKFKAVRLYFDVDPM